MLFFLRFRAVIWFIVLTFSFSSVPHAHIVISEAFSLVAGNAWAEETLETWQVEDDDFITPGLGEAPEGTSPQTQTQKSITAAGEPGGGAIAESSCPQIKGSMSAGAATATIPLAIPPGCKGLTPALAITYNSLRYNSGWIGKGFDLELGSIQARNNKYYYVTGSGAEELLVTGERRYVPVLSKDSAWSQDWADYIYYAPRKNHAGGSFVQVIEHSAYLGKAVSTSWIAVIDGYQYQFGEWRKDGDNNIGYQKGHSEVFSEKWALMSIADQYRNGMIINYKTIADRLYPQSITYHPQYGIEFEMDESAGHLTAVKINNGTQEYARHTLNYESGSETGTTRLQSVVSLAGAHNRPAVSFTWTRCNGINQLCDYLETIDNGQGGKTTFGYTK
jgi:hypothetical protein